MPEILIETALPASREQCYALMRDERIHGETHVERTPASADGAPVLGETVRFESRFLGMSQVLVVRCVEVIPSRRFVDAMTRGRFGLFAHVHELEDHVDGTLLRDMIIWESRSNLFDSTVDELVIKRRLTEIVAARNSRLRDLLTAE